MTSENDVESDSLPSLSLIFDAAINYAFQQNAIPVIKELRFQNNAIARKDITIRISTEPAFATPAEVRLEAIDGKEEFRASPIDLKLSHDFLAGLNERVTGWLKVELIERETTICSKTEAISLLARNEWCGLSALPEILAAFVLPNDPAIMPVLGRAAELLREATGRAALNGYQDKSRSRVWQQIAAIYKAIAELHIRYINPPASFESTGQKVRFPSEIVSQRFGTCIDLVLFFAGCCEQAGLRPLILMHRGHAYAGCWLDEGALPEPAGDDLQHIRKLATDELITLFEATLLTNESPGTLDNAELLALPHLTTDLPFSLALDIHRARSARIHPLPIPGQVPLVNCHGQQIPPTKETIDGIGSRSFATQITAEPSLSAKTGTRIDQWKSRLLDLSLRNRLLNFREVKSTIQILSTEPEMLEDELAASRELVVQQKPKLMSENDPRSAVTYTEQQRSNAILDHIRDELRHGRIHTHLYEPEHSRRLTELFRAARNALEENGTNTLFAAVGILEWRETEHADQVHRAPLLLIPVELKRKSVVEGFSLRRIDEETRLNVTLMEMLRQNFRKDIPALEPLPEDESGVNVGLVFQIFRDAVRDMTGWEVKTEVWLGQFSFTKFLLWKDLSDRLDVLTRNRIVNHLVNEAGTQYSNPKDDVRPNELDNRFHPREIFCPRSADSSQLAAVMAAAAGHDFVLEGPPGTGKSQTITNIIAHCLAEGKRVLFVAEKRAALDVVHRRLREDGLEPFCLELHSNKTGKADVLAQFDRSLQFVSQDPDLNWNRSTTELEKARSALNAYAQALHRRMPCGLTAHRCLDYLLPRKDEPTVQLDGWSHIRETSSEKLEHARLTVQQIQARSAPLLPLEDHPLGLLFCTDWSPSWAERVLEQVQNVGRRSQEASNAFETIRTWLRHPLEKAPFSHLKHLDDFCSSLLTPEPVGADFATTSWATQERDFIRWSKLLEERNQLRAQLRPIHVSRNVATAIVSEKWSEDESAKALEDAKRLLGLTEPAVIATTDLLRWLSASVPTPSRSVLSNLMALVMHLRRALPVAGAFVTTSWPALKHELNCWTELIREREKIRLTLNSFDQPRLLSLDLDKLHEKWTLSENGFFLSRIWYLYSVRRELRAARVTSEEMESSTMGGIIKGAMRLREINRLLTDASPQAEYVLASVWNRSEPSTVDLEAAQSWGTDLQERITGLAAENVVSEETLRAKISEALDTGIGGARQLEAFEIAFGTLTHAIEAFVVSGSLNRRPFEEAANYLGYVQTALATMIEATPRLREINSDFSACQSIAASRLGIVWNNGEPDIITLHRVIEWGRALHARVIACAGDDLAWLAQLRSLLAALFTEGPAIYAQGTSIGDRILNYRERWTDFQQSFGTMVTETRCHRETIENSPDFFGATDRMVERVSASWPKIRDWCYWQKARAQAVQLGLLPVVQSREAKNGDRIDAPALFERSFRRALFFDILEQEPVLRDFFGREHAERIEQFRDLDQRVSSLARDLIRARLADKIPKEGGEDDVPKTEMGLLRKEIGKRMRHIPIRQLINRIPTLLSRLKPCVLMSPLSVAQYLDASHQAFDVVIFDEASQIPVWDAVGAIARGNQLIVVGDPKQLPPTNFFTGNSDDEEDRTPEEHKDLESILDELMTNGLRCKRLQWHYRSRHEGLITFSNRQYYGNDLLTFPSPESMLGGVQFRHLPAARYDKGKSRTNRGEAEALVRELVSRLRANEGPRRSYGVVTFSQAQQQLVENLLDEERRKHPEIESHFGDEPPIESEPVFVKNLENVQGDERDIILFSICYGPDESGKVSVNFGPLNRDGGERRLNVAVTRAKHEIIVFSGLKADQIDLTRTRARGVRDLKYFLDYAERGPKALSASTTVRGDEEADSEFERMVAERIRAAGYDVHHQVGCSGYRIDLGVVDPTCPGRYILGVECDGATYHRAATARDRDKLRQAVLEDLGWTLHRIWSTDWWHDPNKETEKVICAIESLTTSPSQQ